MEDKGAVNPSLKDYVNSIRISLLLSEIITVGELDRVRVRRCSEGTQQLRVSPTYLQVLEVEAMMIQEKCTVTFSAQMKLSGL